jgi:KDO2-lipid IV(A) lauroyltransferase
MSTTEGGPEARGTPFQRARAALLAALASLLGRLPLSAAEALAEAAGELWYRATPGRAAVARGNLAQIAGRLAAEGRGSARARAAARDPRALERLVRAAYRHAAWSYVELLRGSAAAERATRGRIDDDDPAATAAALGRAAPMILVSLHFGSMLVVSSVLRAHRCIPFTAPMETVDDPELQRLLRERRESVGVRTVDLAAARRELRAALARGEGVAIIGDRDVTGGGLAVPLFGLPARLPIGAAWLAIETGAPVHVAAAWRTRAGSYRGWLRTLETPPAEPPRRERVEHLLGAQARAFEDLVANAPEQWEAVFHPIWDAVGPLAHCTTAASAVRPASPPAPPR